MIRRGGRGPFHSSRTSGRPGDGAGAGGQTSAAVLVGGTGSTGAGASRSRFINVASPFFQSIVNANVSQACAVRSDRAAINTKFHVEVTCDNIVASTGKFFCGFANGTAPDFNATGSFFQAAYPGYTDGNAGLTIVIAPGATTLFIYRNGAVSTGTITLAAAWANGDAIIFEVDASLAQPTVAIYHWRVATNTASLRTTETLTSQIPASWYAFQAGVTGNGTVGASDAATANFGAAANKMTPNSGFGIFA